MRWGLAAAWLLFARLAAAEDPYEEADKEEKEDTIDVSVLGEQQDVQRIAGSAHRIGKDELEHNEDDDIHRPLTRVPGVYVRVEDGYGLRPNIGLRGASSDRSSKVTLMEDGVLLGPAPYAAPAAYYFPLATRMTAIEVYKGPSALRYGPNTIGGAINMVSRPVPYGHELGGDLAFGSELYGKAHGHYGYGSDNWGVLVEAVRLRSNGFKELDAPPRYGEHPNTGFDKLELVGKARVNSDPTDPIYNEANVKLGWSREESNETYLGLSDADFEERPLRRYAASQRDNMKWDRTSIALTHALVVRDRFKPKTLLTLRTTAYRHDFHRIWSKLDGFDGGPALSVVLADPTSSANAPYYRAVTQQSDITKEPLRIGNNERTFFSQGIQTSGSVSLPKLGPVSQRLRFGLRLHNDQIVRHHTGDNFFMQNGEMVSTGAPRVVTVDNTGSAVAVAGYLVDEIAFYRLFVTPGLRVEQIFTDFEDRSTGADIQASQHAILPGVGAYYAIVDEFGVLAGVHQGFSPVAPGQAPTVLPEKAVNYEGGARLGWKWARAEAIGFFSDYSNLTGECTFSAGCSEEQLDKEFNAGEAFIYGLEASAGADIPTPVDLKVPINASYTITQTEFRSSFISDNPLWGEVQKGDELPYVPRRQFSLSAGVSSDKWGGLNISGTYVGSMLEQAGRGGPLAGVSTDPSVTVDVATWYQLLPEMQLYFKMENVFDDQHIVSRRPFGARPGRPRFFYFGVKVEIDRPP